MTRERQQRTRVLLIIYLLLALLMVAGICVRQAWAADETGRFLTLLNNYRAGASLSPVVADSRLTAAAAWMAADVLAHCALPVGPCSHTDSLDRPVPARLTASSFPAGLWEAENLAWQSYNGLTTAEQVFATWRGSAEDNGNLLDAKAGLAGVGRACDVAGTCVWVLDLTGTVPPPCGCKQHYSGHVNHRGEGDAYAGCARADAGRAVWERAGCLVVVATDEEMR